MQEMRYHTTDSDTVSTKIGPYMFHKADKVGIGKNIYHDI